MSFKKTYNFRLGYVAANLDDEIKRIYDAINRVDARVTSINNSLSADVASVSDFYRAGAVSVTAGANTITFSSQFPTNDYVLHAYLYNAAEDLIAIDPNPTKTAAGFTITVGEAGTLVYLAVENA